MDIESWLSWLAKLWCVTSAAVTNTWDKNTQTDTQMNNWRAPWRTLNMYVHTAAKDQLQTSSWQCQPVRNNLCKSLTGLYGALDSIWGLFVWNIKLKFSRDIFTQHTAIWIILDPIFRFTTLTEISIHQHDRHHNGEFKSHQLIQCLRFNMQTRVQSPNVWQVSLIPLVLPDLHNVGQQLLSYIYKQQNKVWKINVHNIPIAGKTGDT